MKDAKAPYFEYYKGRGAKQKQAGVLSLVGRVLEDTWELLVEKM